MKEAEKQLGDRETYEELSPARGGASRVKNIGDIPNETLEYIFINKPKLGRLYLLPKIHKQLRNTPAGLLFQTAEFLRKTLQLFLSII